MLSSTLTKVALTVAVALGGTGFLVYSSVDHAQHYMMVDELYKAGDLPGRAGQELKVHGNVTAGSIVEKIVNQEQHRTFLLEKGPKKIRVFSSGPKPDTFKDASEVVATGHLVKATEMKELAAQLGVPLESDLEYVVDASELMAKCPSKYDGAQVNKNLNDADNDKKFQ
jgi:cytochrome c-type biogenesis protein CcmE